MNKELIQLFGPNDALIYYSLEILLNSEKGKSYFFMNEEEYDRIAQHNLKYSNQIFWIELLNRVRYSSMVSLLRSKKWIDGVLLGLQNENLILFSVSLRGLIESGSDANHTFAPIPSFLIKELDDIKLVFDAKSPNILKCKPFEDALIHFSHAGAHIPKSENSKIYNSKQIREYIRYSDDDKESLFSFYKLLSGYVHPSRESVLNYVTITSHSHGENLCINAESDKNELIHFIRSNQKLIQRIFHLSIYPSLLNFKALSMIGIESLVTPHIEAFNIEKSYYWIKAVEMSKKIHQN